ncbi:MAG: hypothetical protein GXY82_10125 [Methanospirillum sp.]|nr:hypothetical protein [Methanospirillum sp.]
MNKESGQFVKGRWVEGTPGTEQGGEESGPEAAGGSSDRAVEDRLGEAAASVTKAVDDVMGAVRTLVGTDEGHRYLEERVERTGEALKDVLKDLQERVQATIRKK